MKQNPSWRVVLFLIIFLVMSSDIHAQDYLLLYEGFESPDDTTWIQKNASVTDKQSYGGQKSMSITGRGESAYILSVPDGVKEIVVRGWVKVAGSAEAFREKGSSSNYNKGDTIMVVSNTYVGTTVSVESFDETTGKRTLLVKDAVAVFIDKNSSWTNFEKEIKIPPGIKNVRVICRNTIAGTTAWLDELEVEKRQLGFSRSESSWAKSVRAMQEKAKLLVKNGDFEDGGQPWNQYWGFELSGIAHSGEYSCLIQNKDSGAWRGSGNEKLFKIPAGTKKLKISVWIKADNVVGGPNPWETGALLLSFADDYGNEVPGGDAVARTVGTHDWRKFESYFSVSERATNFRIAMQLGASTGKIYFDDIVAEPMTDEQFYLVNINLKNPGFENLLSGWPAYAGEASTDFAHSGNYSLKVSSENAAWDMRMQTISLVKEKKELTFTVWIKTVNITETPNSWEGARAYIEFKDINGISLNTENVGRAIGTTDWQKFTATIKIPEDAVEFTIFCGRANVSGSAYFDDAKLEY